MRNILLIISGGIAAYKALELIRLFKKNGDHVRCILTKGGQQFVTPLSVSALCEEEVYTDLWSLKDESEMGHIRLVREADAIIIAPASANMLAKLAHGLADDLASTAMLANDDTPVYLAPAMNPAMWNNAATRANIDTLIQRRFHFIGPEAGEAACGETGIGRMSEPEDIFNAINLDQPLSGKKIIVTSGPTIEPLDPVRFLGNRSSGKQGHAIAAALQKQGAEVHLVSGPVSIPAPTGCTVHNIETAAEMQASVENLLPCDIAIFAAAVCDWRAAQTDTKKIKKIEGQPPPSLQLDETPDILQSIATRTDNRPNLVIGFAAETGDLQDKATQKIHKKGCDWLIANDVSEDNMVFGSDENTVLLLKKESNNTITYDQWPRLSKNDVADRLAATILETLSHGHDRTTTTNITRIRDAS